MTTDGQVIETAMPSNCAFAPPAIMFTISPIGTLGASYLASVHMLQYMLCTFMVAPLLLLAAPEAWTRERLIRWRLGGLVEYAAHPFRAAIFANAVLLATHAPWTVDQLRASQIGSFALDVVWLDRRPAAGKSDRIVRARCRLA